MDRIFITVVYIHGKNTIRLSFTMKRSASSTVIFEGFLALNERVRPKVIVPGRMHSSVGETDLATFITHLRFDVQSVTNAEMNWRNSCFWLRSRWSRNGVAMASRKNINNKVCNRKLFGKWQKTSNIMGSNSWKFHKAAQFIDPSHWRLKDWHHGRLNKSLHKPLNFQLLFPSKGGLVKLLCCSVFA